MPHHGGQREKCQGQSGGRGRSKGKTCAGPSLWLSRKEWERRGRQAEVTLDNVGGISGTGAIPIVWYLDLGDYRAGGGGGAEGGKSSPWGGGMALDLLACI